MYLLCLLYTVYNVCLCMQEVILVQRQDLLQTLECDNVCMYMYVYTNMVYIVCMHMWYYAWLMSNVFIRVVLWLYICNALSLSFTLHTCTYHSCRWRLCSQMEFHISWSCLQMFTEWSSSCGLLLSLCSQFPISPKWMELTEYQGFQWR